jgi:hypothetical protein
MLGISRASITNIGYSGSCRKTKSFDASSAIAGSIFSVKRVQPLADSRAMNPSNLSPDTLRASVVSSSGLSSLGVSQAVGNSSADF